jgi:threonine dehydrogenase-like Zn-dependent dehydrogenase
MSGNPSLVFTAPGRVEVLDCAVPQPKPGEVLIRTLRSLISTGTELTLLHGQAPASSAWAEISQFPQSAGYSNVGEVVEVGHGVEDAWRGCRVGTHRPHAAWVACPVEDLRVLPPTVAAEDATFTTLAEVVMNGLRRARLIWGESVAIFGLGILGHLATRLAALGGAGPLFAIEPSDLRRGKLPRSPWIHALEPGDPAQLRDLVAEQNHGRRVDLVIELTADPQLIPGELELVRDLGRLLVLSSPRGDTRFDFHDLCNRRSLSLIGAHGFSHPDAEWPDYPWTGRRHGELFLDWVAEGRITVKELITHHFSFEQAADAYAILSKRRGETLGVVFEWD